ncbi:transcription factor bHLH94-like [Juglans regia]|uniref:Transcription factor bHLH94-like n=2 Tax=Juglans regia TaxID=51240 RepID=A0A2I4GCZ2_JUGRE|nr:transcription factor bHLH94-like [Juglans regia]
MALEAVVFPQDPFAYSTTGYNFLASGGNWSYDFVPQNEDEQQAGAFDSLENQTENCLYGGYHSSTPSMQVPAHDLNELHNYDPSTLDANNDTVLIANETHHVDHMSMTTMPTRPKRRRAKSRKNKEEIENQRMTHIAVERNRRKQMNEYLSMLRSLMPDSYIQRGDQASIIGGAINFVKELEQRLQLLGAQKESEEKCDAGDVSLPFSEFFTFPQYSTSSSTNYYCDNYSVAAMSEQVGESTQSAAIADIEVTMVESHANLKIRSKRRPKQLLKVVSGLHTMRLTVLHLNVTTADEVVLYSLSVKVEDDCKLSSVDEIATAVHQMLGRIQEDQEILLNY